MARKWTKDEEILAFCLYCKTPFGKIHTSNRSIKDLALRLDRTPASVSMKMCNFARFDPALRERGIVGLANGSKLDEEVWNEFSQNLEALGIAGHEIAHSHETHGTNEAAELLLPSGDNIERTVQTRKNQDFFRETLIKFSRNPITVI